MRSSVFVSTLVVLALAAPAAAYARTLSAGMSGSDVTALQRQLIARGYLAPGNANGSFGPVTLAAVQKFQCAQKITCSGAAWGLVGPKTSAALAANAAPVQPTTITAGMTPAATGAFEVSGWIPDWRAASGTADVLPHLSNMTSVMPFGYAVDSSGRLVDHAHIAGEPWASFIAAARAARVRVVPTVLWGSGTAMQSVLSSSAKRVALENAIAAMVKDNGFSGVDIDFEAKEASTINYFSTFLKGLSQRLGSKWLYCTVEARSPLNDRYLPGQTIPPDAANYANDYAAMNTYCDRVELMTYDQGTIDQRLNVARSAPYAPVADPGWVEDVVRLAAQTIARNKLVVGIPTYGYEYRVTPTAAGYQYKVLWAFNPPYALKLAAQFGLTPTRTSANELGFTYIDGAAAAPQNGDVTQGQQGAPADATAQNAGSSVSGTAPFNFVTWSDAQAMKDKVDLAKRLGVRGVAFFSLGGADDQGLWQVLP
jgi:spore germination protein YaaH